MNDQSRQREQKPIHTADTDMIFMIRTFCLGDRFRCKWGQLIAQRNLLRVRDDFAKSGV